jgi:hypothetical protein
MHKPTSWSVLKSADGGERRNAKGQRQVRVEGFEPRPLPLFLEGAVKALRNAANPADARALHEQVRASGLYDRSLGMYKVNAPIAGESVHIGRIRAYTPGWLENESVFLHMHYKYLLAMLQAGLYAEFWAAARQCLVPFLDPEVYGRSILENSSFIVSSAHPDKSLHGRGFVARLSGSTAEFIHIWTIVSVGARPFQMGDQGLMLNLTPALPGWLFKDDGTLRITFLGSIPVTYHHPERTDLFPGEGYEAGRVVVRDPDGNSHELGSGPIVEPWASRIRDRQVAAMDVYFE